MCPSIPLIVFLLLHFTPYALRITLYTFYSSLITHSLYLKLRFPSFVPSIYTPCQRPRMNQRRNNRSSPMGEIRTKDEPRNYQRTPKPKKCVLLILSSLSPFLYLASKHRANTERRPRELRLNSPPTKSAIC